MTIKHHRRFVVLATVVALVLAIAAPASAAPKMNNTQISGTAVIVEECNGESSLFTFDMSPSPSGWGLDGCWYTSSIEEKKALPNGVYQETGTETFVGDLTYNGVAVQSGTFDTTYLFSAKFTPDFSAEIHGRCQHPIVSGSGTGVFDGSTGRVDFKDDVENAIFNYRGHIKVDV